MAAVHFRPIMGDVAGNRAELVQLTTQAAQNGAKIVVHTEMATSGYSSFSRKEIAQVAEPLPGPTTAALGQVASQYGVYVAVGLPEFDRTTQLYYNAVALIGPDGTVVGKYRKRNSLLEASYNAQVFAPVPTFETPYGRIAIVICADLFYSQYSRAASVAGATIILAPMNSGFDSDSLKVRTVENDAVVIVANRYGEEIKGTKPAFFSQDSFAITSPYVYNFNYGTRSMIVTNTGEILANYSDQSNAIVYGDVPVRLRRRFPVHRKPGMYSLLAQDTLHPFNQPYFGLPAPAVFAAAAIDPGPSSDPWAAALTAAQRALAGARSAGETLRLAVFPANYFSIPDETGTRALHEFAVSNDVDLQIHFGGTVPPRSVLLSSDGHSYDYPRTHKRLDEPIPPVVLSDHYWVVDRDYGRVALMQDVDMLPPETSHVLSRMGVDVVAVSADSRQAVLSALWQSRTSDYLHIVVANRSAPEGIYHGGYQVFPPLSEAEGEVIEKLNTAHVRNKPAARFFDAEQILQPCSILADNC